MIRRRSRWSLCMLCLLLLVFTNVKPSLAQTTAKKPSSPASTDWQAAPWPQVITNGTETLTIYQPQLDSWDGYTLTARSAVAATKADGESTYGIVHMSAHTLVDKSARWVMLDQYQIVKVDFPSSPTQADSWVALLKKDAQTRKKTISLDQMESAIGTLEAQQTNQYDPLQNNPPAIISSPTPALLVYIDGEPAYRSVTRTTLERVINTRPLLLRDPQGKHYLHVFDGWMVADVLSGPYARLAEASEELEKAQKDAIDGRQVDLLSGQAGPDDKAPSLGSGTIPEIFIATTPTELIVTDGAVRWLPIQGTHLLYVENTTGNVFKEIGDQYNYLLISGRWFKSQDMAGPWIFVAANDLPDDFANIPDNSPKENVKASVAGTPQAREAAIAASIPQTSVIDKTVVKMTEPHFDGSPQLQPIIGTTLQYAINTAAPVILVAPQQWYAVENGIWFFAPSEQGPWAVASTVPAAIYTIPASSPLHYVTYVKVYNATGNAVVVGYTPGYQGTQIDPVSGVVIYGTGYRYTPWVGSVWYGPPVTYGLGAAVRYTPWTGWTVGFGFGWHWRGGTTVTGWGCGAYPWWGPYGWGYAWGPKLYPAPIAWAGGAYGYRGGAVVWGPGGWAGTTGNIYSQWGSKANVSRYSAGYNAWTGNRWATQAGTAYNSRTGIAAAGQRGAVHNVYSGDYVAGTRGIATGPNGTVVAGQRATAGNSKTGNQVSGSRGVAYNPNTGKSTKIASLSGKNANAVRVGDNVYAGNDGNVYKKTASGWESIQQPPPPTRPPQTQPKPPTRPVAPPTAAPKRPTQQPRMQQSSTDNRPTTVPTSYKTNGSADSNSYQNLDRESAARAQGNQRLKSYQSSSQMMNQSYGGSSFRRQ